MSKSDFEKINLQGIPEPLVVPKPANDPYDGIFVPAEGVFTQAILDDVLTATEVDLLQYQIQGPRRRTPFESQE